MFKFLFRLTLFGLPMLILINIGMSSAATLNVSSNSQNVFTASDSITAEKVKPLECAGITLVDITITDGNGNNNLIIGTGGNDNLDGNDGDDCIVGVDGADTLRGEKGDDVIVGGAGDDVLDGKQGSDSLYGGDGNDDLKGGGGPPSVVDFCDGGSGTDTSNGCETEINIP
jgi:Ca2+-binding RTX toxin-like protein